MPLLYDIGTGLYHLGIRAAAPFNLKAKAWADGRKGIWNRLKEKAPELQGCLWMHCSSLGEFEQGRPVLESIKAQRPELPVLLTFFSPSGYEVMKHYSLATHVEYLPPDGHANARRMIEMLAPKAAIFVKYEFWFHYLHQLSRSTIPTYLISARFRPEQPFFNWYGNTHKTMLRSFKHLFVQDVRSMDLLRTIGIGNISLSGDTRFDRVHDIVSRNEELSPARSFKEKNTGPILICGSTWPNDEAVILPALATLKTPPALIIAPHELGSSRLETLVKKLPDKVSRWSRNDEVDEASTLLIDTIGPLARAYRYGDIAYVGGGFDDGIHNLLEAAAWGKPVIFGPNHRKFTEAEGLIQARAGFRVNDSAEFAQVIDRLLKDPALLSKASKAAANYVQEHTGATMAVTTEILADI